MITVLILAAALAVSVAALLLAPRLLRRAVDAMAPPGPYEHRGPYTAPERDPLDSWRWR